MVGCCELRLSRFGVLCRAQTILGMPGNGLGAVAVWESFAELPELREDLRRAEWQSCPLVDRTQLGNEVLDLVTPSQDCSLLAFVLVPESKELLDSMFADVIGVLLGVLPLERRAFDQEPHDRSDASAAGARRCASFRTL